MLGRFKVKGHVVVAKQIGCTGQCFCYSTAENLLEQWQRLVPKSYAGK